MGNARLQLLAALPFVALVACNQSAPPTGAAPSGERPGLRASVRAQVQALNAAGAAQSRALSLAEEPLVEAPEAGETQSVYLDVLPDVAPAQDVANLESLYLGEFAQGTVIDPDAAAAAAVDYVARHPELYGPGQPDVSLAEQGTLSAQQLGGVTTCTRRVDNPHISRTSPARGQIIAKGTINCNPSGRYTISARATMTLQKAGWWWSNYASNSISFALSRTAPVNIPSYQYFAVGSCTSGNYRAVSDIAYYGPQFTISYSPSAFSRTATINCP